MDALLNGTPQAAGHPGVSGNELIAQAMELYNSAMWRLQETQASFWKAYEELWQLKTVLQQLDSVRERQLSPEPVAENGRRDDQGRYANILLLALRNLGRAVEWPELLEEARKRTLLDPVRLKDRELSRLVRIGKVIEQGGKYSLA